MPYIEKKRIARTEEAGTRIVRMCDADLGWSDLWSLTQVREFEDPAAKDGHWIVQIAYILRDQRGRVGVYERAARQAGGQRYSAGYSVLAGSSLLGWEMLEHHDVTFVKEYPALEPYLPPAAVVGGIRYLPLGVGYSITKRVQDGKEKTRRYIFVIYEARVQIRDDAGQSAAGERVQGGVSPEEDVFCGMVGIDDAVSLLEAADDRLNMDLAVLDGLRGAEEREGGAQEAGVARRGTTCFRLSPPRGTTRPVIVRMKAWRDRHPWVMMLIWAGSLLLASVADLRGAFGY